MSPKRKSAADLLREWREAEKDMSMKVFKNPWDPGDAVVSNQEVGNLRQKRNLAVNILLKKRQKQWPQPDEKIEGGEMGSGESLA